MSPIMKVLKYLYQEGQTENPMSYAEIAKNCSVSAAYVSSVARKLVSFEILETSGSRRAYKYKWVSTVTPNDSLAIRLGRTQIVTKKIVDFEDQELISELKNRGYIIFKEV